MTINRVEVPEDFSQRLVSALQPIRHSFVASTLQYLFTSGLYDELEQGIKMSDSAVSGYDEERLKGLFEYLLNESIVLLDPTGTYWLTQSGKDFGPYRPWYELLMGGYSRTLDDLPETMQDGTVYASRNDAAVGRGSCGISEYDALPMLRALINESLDTPPNVIADLGCGDGNILLQLGRDYSHVIGVDPAPGNISAARKLAAEMGFSDRSEFIEAGAEEYMSDSERRATPGVCYLAAFALQEVLEQVGRDAVVSMIRQALEAPGNSMAIVEVTPFQMAEGCMENDLEIAYYNPYYLIHTITRQRLETETFWKRVFVEAGAQIVGWRTTDVHVDSTGREFGALLTKAENHD